MSGGGGGTTGGGGGACICPTNTCGLFDAGCAMLECGLCLNGNECGVTTPNVCGRPRLCQADGWCFENPLPQGNTIHGMWVASDREVFLAGDNATLLLWNGEKHVTIPLPPLGDGVDLWGAHGRSSSDYFVVGTRGTILHFANNAFTLEALDVPQAVAFHSVRVDATGLAYAVAGSGEIFKRPLTGPPWQQMARTFGLYEWNALADDGVGDFMAVGTLRGIPAIARARFASGDGGIWREPSGQVPMLTGNAIWRSASGVTFIAGGAHDGGGAILERLDDGGWSSYFQTTQELTSMTGNGSGTLYVAGVRGLIARVEPDGGVTSVNGTSGWNALGRPNAGTFVEGSAGAVAFWPDDAGVLSLSSGHRRHINALCVDPRNEVFAAAEANPCSGPDCVVPMLDRASDGRWLVTNVMAPDASAAIGCGSALDFHSTAFNDSRNANGQVLAMSQVWNANPTPLAGQATSFWLERLGRGWIANSERPTTALPFVIRTAGVTISNADVVRYDGGGDLITVFGGVNVFNGPDEYGWALGENGLAFQVRDDGGLEPAARVGTSTFRTISGTELVDGGVLIIAAGESGSLFRFENGLPWVDEGALNVSRLTASAALRNGDLLVGGAQTLDAGTRVASRLFRRGAPWTVVPVLGDEAFSALTVRINDAGVTEAWIGRGGGAILQRTLP